VAGNESVMAGDGREKGTAAGNESVGDHTKTAGAEESRRRQRSR